MSEFHRMITYLYLYEHGIKRHNVGFAKIEKKDSQCLAEIHMKNTGHNIPSVPVYFYAENGQQFPGVLLGTMGLSRGNGDFKVILNGENLSDSGYTLDQIRGIFIPLDQQVMFVSQWNDREFVREHFVEPRAEKAVPKVSKEVPAKISERTEPPLQNTPKPDHPQSVPNREPMVSQTPLDTGNPSETQAALDTALPAAPADLKAAEALPKLSEIPSSKPSAPSHSPARPKPEPLPENWNVKWEFILENYPVMTPFAGDENTLCIRMELKDLRLLPRQYWYLGNNSFLLHGFFNYRYLILGMTEKAEKKRWFIGIPGVYQNPERVMATLFGFPEFRNEKSLPINTGEFGYWYRYLNE